MLLARMRSVLAVGIVLVIGALAIGGQLPGVQEERSWTLEASGGFGMVTAVARCGNTLFIADTHQQIRRFDIATGSLLGDFGKGRVSFATSLAVDCPRGQLFVIT